MATRAVEFEQVAVPQPRPSFVEKRSEVRREGVVDFATLVFRSEELRVPVVNISSRGTMIECEVAARLGESVMIKFDGCSPLYAFVRWSREGRIGLNFGGELTIG